MTGTWIILIEMMSGAAVTPPSPAIECYHPRRTDLTTRQAASVPVAPTSPLRVPISTPSRFVAYQPAAQSSRTVLPDSTRSRSMIVGLVPSRVEVSQASLTRQGGAEEERTAVPIESDAAAREAAEEKLARERTEASDPSQTRTEHC